MHPNELIECINQTLRIKSDSELATKLTEISGKKIDKSQISRWRRSGFYGSTEALIKLLLSHISNETKQNI